MVYLLCATFSDVYKKIKSDITVPLKQNFYRKYVDGMFNEKMLTRIISFLNG